jgi:ATP-dependent helicase/DNAse subunit B
VEKLRLSASSLSIYETCPYKWKRIYIDGLQEPSHPLMEFGAKVHEELCRLGTEIYQSKSLTNITSSLEWINNLLPILFQDVLIAKQVMFEVKLTKEEDYWYLTGVIDRIVITSTGVFISDYKISSRNWEKVDVMRNWQYLLYPYLASSLGPVHVFEIIQLNPKKYTVCRYSWFVLKDMFNIVREKLQAVYDRIRRKKFENRFSKQCRYCFLYSECKHLR